MTLLLLFLSFGGGAQDNEEVSSQHPVDMQDLQGPECPQRKLMSPNLLHCVNMSQGRLLVRMPQRSFVSKDLTSPSPGEERAPVGDQALPNSLFLFCFCSELCHSLFHLCLPQMPNE